MHLKTFFLVRPMSNDILEWAEMDWMLELSEALVINRIMEMQFCMEEALHSRNPAIRKELALHRSHHCHTKESFVEYVLCRL